MKTLYLAIKIETGWKYVRSVQVSDNFDIGEEGSDTRALVDQLLVTMSYWAGDMGHQVNNSHAGFIHPSEFDKEKKS